MNTLLLYQYELNPYIASDSNAIAGYNLTVDGSSIHEFIYDHEQYINYYQAENFLKEDMGSALGLSRFYFYVCNNSPYKAVE